MKYLAALLIGIGLLAHNPASAEKLKFGELVAAPMKECLEAAKRGFQVHEKHDLSEETGVRVTMQKFLISGIKMGVNWRIYEIFYYQNVGGPEVECYYVDLISRTT